MIECYDCPLGHVETLELCEGYCDEMQEWIRKDNKYKWHNLRKDSEDLPDTFSKVLVCYRLSPKMNIYEVCWYEEGYFCLSFGRRKFDNINVLGWREVEPFPFEED